MDKTGTTVIPDVSDYYRNLDVPNWNIKPGWIDKTQYAGCSGKAVNLNRNYYYQEITKLFRSIK